ncbi:4Fe-4S dicluster domain-containing protein [Desulfovibrio sp. SGI.169]|uniref:4Fe-4S dicluster domain-containing protein n=1 Tax=Desulfovibrio sp. SGI.169 TaxID=3420561 RepID=UPI003D00E5EB
MNGTLHILFFSPTHSSRGIALALGDGLNAALGMPQKNRDLTFPAGREKSLNCAPDDILVFAFPVYGGRVPRTLEAPLSRLRGNGATAVIAAVYGNRDYDDALLEAADLLTRQGFTVTAAGAFIAEHSVAPSVGAGRPDAADMAALTDFARRAAAKIAAGKPTPISVKGKRPYKDRKPATDVRPKTADSCTRCMICVAGCPMRVISRDDPAVVAEGCIRCRACVKFCPERAKFFDDAETAKIREMLESKCLTRREPELFL